MKMFYQSLKQVVSFTAAVSLVIAGMLLGSIGVEHVYAQLQQSGGAGSTVTANAGTNLNTSALALDATLSTVDTDIKSNVTLHAGANVIGHVIADASSAVIGHVIVDTAPTTAVTFSSPALAGGTANIGFVRVLPSSCTQSTNFSSATAQVATGAGTSVSSTTTCITYAYANNITNSAVTLRVADKTGTPVIWLGGNADFSIPANSNMRIPIDGVTFTSGITAIAGTASAINLQVNGVQ